MFPYTAASVLPTGYSYPAGYRGGYSSLVGVGVNPYHGNALSSAYQAPQYSFPYSSYSQIGYGLPSAFAPSYVLGAGFGVAGPASSGIKLTYFDIDGRAEPIRLAFYLGNVVFEDERLSREEWAKAKENARFGQLPLLEVGGRVLAETFAQLIFAGQLTGLYPSDVWAQAKVHEALLLAEDISSALRPSAHEQDPEKKQELRAKFVEELPTYFKYIENLLAQSGTGYFVGTTVTIADLFIYNLLNILVGGSIDGVPSDILKDFPLITAFVERINAIPKVAEWNAKKAQAKADKEAQAKAAEEAQKAAEAPTTGNADATAATEAPAAAQE